MDDKTQQIAVKKHNISIRAFDAWNFSIFCFRSFIFFVSCFLLTTTIIVNIRCICVHSTRSTNFVYEWYHVGMGNDSNIQHIVYTVYYTIHTRQICQYTVVITAIGKHVTGRWQNTNLKSKLVFISNGKHLTGTLSDFVNIAFDLISPFVLLMTIYNFDFIWLPFSKLATFRAGLKLLKIVFLKFYLWFKITWK